MNLADHREAMLRHALHEIHFPRWTASVQRRRRDITDQLIEFSTAPGARTRTRRRWSFRSISDVSNRIG